VPVAPVVDHQNVLPLLSRTSAFKLQHGHEDDLLEARRNASQLHASKKIEAIDEQTRFEVFTRLRQRMFQLVRDHNCSSRRGWIRAFERWHYTAISSSLHNKSRSRQEQMIDPLLPSGSKEELAYAREELRKDLEQLDEMTVSSAASIADQISSDSSKLAAALSLRIKSKAAEGLVAKPKRLIEVLDNKYNEDVFLRLAPEANTLSFQPKGQVVRGFAISGEHLRKMRILWNTNMNIGDEHNKKQKQRKTTGRSSVVVEGKEEEEEEEEEEERKQQRFLNDLFVALARYQAVESFGYHAAATEHVIACLAQEFGVSCECFSSPFNCYLPTYCSAYPDTDVPFGSLGSFFDFYPSCGSFEANPPFSQPLMARMIVHMHNLLTNAEQHGGAMSFAVIVPAWQQDAHWSLLATSPYLTSSITIPSSDHVYCDGAQHQFSRAQRYRAAPFASAVFFLQNTKGKETWPCVPGEHGNLVKLEAAWRQVKNVTPCTSEYVPKKRRPIAAVAEEQS